MKRTFEELLESLAAHPDAEDVAVDVGYYLAERGGDLLRFLAEPVVLAESSPPPLDDDGGVRGGGMVADGAVDDAERRLAASSVAFQPHSSKRGFQPSEWQRQVLELLDVRRRAVRHKVGLLVIATGLGKTVIACLDVQREMGRSGDKRVRRLQRRDAPTLALDGDVNDGDSNDGDGSDGDRIDGPNETRPFRLLFLVHSKSIRDGAYQKFMSHFGVWYPRAAFYNHDAGGALPSLARVLFVFALFQSFDKLDAGAYSHVIVDEVHHVLAPTYSRHVKELLADPQRYVLGMTATLQHRIDPNGDGIRALFRNTVYFTYDWMAAKRTHFPQDVEYLECLPLLARGKDVQTYQQCVDAFAANDSLAHFLNALQRTLVQTGMDDPGALLTPRYVVDMLLRYQRARADAGLAPRLRVLVFAASVADADTIAEMLTSDGTYTATSVSYKSKDADTRLRNFADGKVQILVSCNMISEGFDVPACDMAVLARLTDSEIVFSQQLGRVLRGRASVCVLDLALNLRRRWRRLQDDLTDAALKQAISAFFPVSNFWPLAE